MKADGFSLDDKRTEVKENDIPDIVARFHNREGEKARERTEQSFLVPREEIAANGYDLSINKYKKVEYVPVEYPSTQEILADLNDIVVHIFQQDVRELFRIESLWKESPALYGEMPAVSPRHAEPAGDED